MGSRLITDLRRDLGHAVRVLLKSPGYTCVAVLALAIGIGVNLTIFGLVNATLFHPIAAPDAHRLIRAQVGGGGSIIENQVSFDEYLAYRDRNQTLTSLALFHWGGIASVRRGGSPAEPIHIMPVTGSYFEVLGVSAATGRTLEAADDRPGAPRVVVVSDEGWRRHFNADPRIVGETLFIFGTPFTVVGVLPPSFTGTTFPVIPRIYVPWVHSAPPPSVARGGGLIGRLRPGATLPLAQADAARIAAQLAAERRQAFAFDVYAGDTAVRTSATTLLFASLFMVIVASVLWVACSNLAILQLARTAARRREMAIRLAIGATRSQLLRQVLVEMLLLAAIASAVAAALAIVCGRWLTGLQPPVPMPLGLAFSFDWRVVAYAIGLTVAATLLSGFGAALDARRTTAGGVLLHESTDSVGARVRMNLVGTQVGLSTTLLMVAASLGLSLSVAQPRGFDAGHVLLANVPLRQGNASVDQSWEFADRLLADQEHASDVVAATLVETIPLANNRPLSSVAVSGDEGTAGTPSAFAPETFRVLSNRVSRGHFRTLGIPLVAGRDFAAGDTRTAPPVVIVNRTLALRLWPTGEIVGRRLRVDSGWVTVIGVAEDSKYERLDEPAKAFLYRPLSQSPEPIVEATLLIKTVGAPAASAPLVRARVAAIDPDIAVSNLIPFEDRLALALLPNLTGATLAGLLGSIALGLGAIGTYSIMAFLVLQRRREIGIRIALGGVPAAVVGMIARQGLRSIAVGLAAGVTLGVALLRFLQGSLYGVSAANPLPVIAVVLVLGGVGGMACIIPARRAAGGDPLAILRE